MITDIHEFRAAMIKAGLFRKRELGQFRWLSPGMQQQRNKLRDAFDIYHPFIAEMATCGQISEWDNVRYCGIPLCPRCFMRERKKQTRQAICETFKGCANEGLAFATILLPPIMFLDDLRGLMDKEKRKFVNLANRKRRQDSRWDDFQMLGWWEVDRMAFGELNEAGRKTRIALEGLGLPLWAADDDTLWRPHLHVMIQRGGVPLDEIKQAFKADGHSGPYQVDIQAFDADRPINLNIKRIVRYCLKFRIEADFKGKSFGDFAEGDHDGKRAREWWPDKDIRAYAGWLKGDDMAGFRSLRFALGKKKAATPAVIHDEAATKVETNNVLMGDSNGECDVPVRVDVLAGRNGTYGVSKAMWGQIGIRTSDWSAP